MCILAVDGEVTKAGNVLYIRVYFDMSRNKDGYCEISCDTSNGMMTLEKKPLSRAMRIKFNKSNNEIFDFASEEFQKFLNPKQSEIPIN